VQKAALYGLADHDDVRINVGLLKDVALSADNEELARAAMYALADVMEDEDIGLVLEVYEKTPFYEVRRAAIHVMLDIGGDEALPAIKSILKKETDSDLRISAVWALEEADDEDEVVKILADVAKNDPSTRVRRAAIQVRGEIDTDEAHEALLQILEERTKKKNKD